MIDFLCIGAQKAATTWLMANLTKHPGVWTPKFIKEIHYFDVVHLGTKRLLVLKSYQRQGAKIAERKPEFKPYFDRVMDPAFAFSEDWYAHIFSAKKPKTLAGECTPLYSSLPDEGIAHVKRMCPNVRLIYMIRDPYARMMSSIRMKMEKKGVVDGSKCKHLLKNRSFISRGDYRTNIPRWEKQFGEGSILYIPFGKVKNDPMGVLRDVENHLGLKAFDAYPKPSEQVHPTKKNDITFDEAMIQRVRDLVAPQYEFLTEKWGAEFVESIR